MNQKRKMGKRISSWLLCMVMVLSVMNLFGFTQRVQAATPLEKINITAPNYPDFTEVCGGSTDIDKMINAISIDTEYYTLDPNGNMELSKYYTDENGLEKTKTIRLSKSAEVLYGKPKNYEEIFTEGKYQLYIEFKSTDKACHVSPYTKVTVNGWPAKISTGGGPSDYMFVFFTFEVQHKSALSPKYEYNEIEHWRGTCSGCGGNLRHEAHSLKTIIDSPATASADGSKHEECSVCGYKKSSVVIPRHIHEYAGGLGYYIQQADSESHWRFCNTCHEQETSKHTFGLGKITKQPTTLEEGEKVSTCTACGWVKKEKVPKLGDPVKTILHEPGTALAIEDSIFSVKKKAESVEYRMPLGNSVTVSIPATVVIDGINYKVTAIADGAFKNNTNITSVEIGPNVTSIGVDAFSGCKKLNNVVMGSNVSKIGNKAFYKCTALTQITIPAKVTKIGNSAFEGCKKLKNVTIKTTKLKDKTVGAKAFKGISATAKVKVPKKQFTAYKKVLKKKGISGKKQKVQK